MDLNKLTPVEKVGFYSAFLVCEGVVVAGVGLYTYNDIALVIGAGVAIYAVASFIWFFIKFG